MASTPAESIPEVFVVLFDTTCAGCSVPLGQGSWATRTDQTMKCMPCSELDGLEFLPSGDVALTRAAQRISERKAVVLRFNKSKRRCERQGILVTAEAIESARLQCQADEPERLKKRQSSAKSREKQQLIYVENFARCIREMYPNAPVGIEKRIADHACNTGSGRVGRTAAAKQLSTGFIGLAVIAYVRHNHTVYDQLLAQGVSRDQAREQVGDKINEVLASWAATRNLPEVCSQKYEMPHLEP
jgi:hypothetical protein